MQEIKWPDGKDFVFTIFDDTDLATVENTKPVYDFLKDCGFKTTKSIWPLSGKEILTIRGDTCEDPEYLNWIKELQSSGFEIGFHNATYHSSFREQTIKGIKRFEEIIGHSPDVMAQHADCIENIYWGENRMSGLQRFVYNILTRGKGKKYYKGHIEGSPYFWGDICREKIRYVRNFVYSEIDTLKKCPFIPYHDPQRPYVNFWFASTEGAAVQSFNNTLAEENQDRLEAEGGACIMYTHFANGFYLDGRLDKRFESLIKRLAKKNGWFVPVSTLLDYLRERNGDYVITNSQRRALERKWLLHKIQVGTT
jgi:hypothetical protein